MTGDETSFNERFSDPRTFDTTRYTSDNLTFWVPHLIRIGQLTPATPLLDLGCGTGGFTLALQALTGARVVGVDVSFRRVQYAAQKPTGHGLWWVHGRAEALPCAAASFARVLLSLVLHQVSDQARVLGEVARVLQPGGLVIIRTITPEATQQRMPWRFFPTIAEREAMRMPTIAAIDVWLRDAGCALVHTEVVERQKVLNFQAMLQEVQERPSTRALTTEDFTRGVAAMQEAWVREQGWVVDPRPTLFIVGQKRGS
jgi:ubiquinone/menaquinone biosynthesis C-methylase UbiE